jgi:hypothetical protein
LREFTKNADFVEVEFKDNVTFFDNGCNTEAIFCPHCSSELPGEWWGECMNSDHTKAGFKLQAYQTPCCDSKVPIHELTYRWPQGFASFALTARNPHEPILTDAQLSTLQSILGTPLLVIHRHI